MARPPRIPVMLPLDQRVIYFATICVARRQPVLHTDPVFDAARDFCASHTKWLTIALVIMPDHIHALAAPFDRDAQITQFSAGLKRVIRRATRGEWRWQDGVFDRLLRREESACDKWLYMRENPVRAGLVAAWEQWPYFIGFRDDGSEN